MIDMLYRLIQTRHYLDRKDRSQVFGGPILFRRSVDIRQNFLQRIFNVGYNGIDSAGQDDVEIEIRDIPSPFNVKRTIDRHRNVGVGHD